MGSTDKASPPAEPSRASEATHHRTKVLPDFGDTRAFEFDDDGDDKERSSGILIHDDGTVTSTAVFLVAAPALYLAGRPRWAALALLVAALLLWGSAAARRVPIQDKLEIRFDVVEAGDVVRTMAEWEQRMIRAADETSRQDKGRPNPSSNGEKDHQRQQRNDDGDDASTMAEHRRKLLLRRGMLTIRVGLSALAKKYGQAQQRRKRRNMNRGQRGRRGNINNVPRGDVGDGDDGVELLCQEAAYIGFRTVNRTKFGVPPSPSPSDSDSMVAISSLSLSLLALVAKNPDVQERCAFYGIDQPVRCMGLALDCAKYLPAAGAAVNPADDEGDNDGWELEQRHAELQRKGCLLLGALCGGGGGGGEGGGAATAQASPRDMAALVAQEGGVQAVLDALDHFRYHSDVANWALWALFTMCYESPANRRAVLELRGIPIALRAMQNCPDSVEVARHGTALLFDLMRQGDDDNDDSGMVGSVRADAVDVWKVRKAAVDAGLHPALIQVLKNFVEEADIAMMSREMLVGTNYRGDDLSPYLVPGR